MDFITYRRNVDANNLNVKTTVQIHPPALAIIIAVVLIFAILI